MTVALVMCCILSICAVARSQDAVGTVVPAEPGAPPVEGTDLLSTDLAKTWKSYPMDIPAGTEATWTIVRETPESEPILICNGRTKGFLWTIEKFEDFEFTAEWKYPKDTDGNSGFLIHTQQEERIWPTSVQIQLHQPKVGSIFPSGDATTDNILEAPPDLARPINSWNECRVVSRSGRITIEVNGKRAGEVTGAKPSSGHLALQSEGSEVHFRRLRIRRLTAGSDSGSEKDESTVKQKP